MVDKKLLCMPHDKTGLQNLKIYLFKLLNGKCENCNRKMILFSSRKQSKKGYSFPLNLATIEHIYPKNHPLRYNPKILRTERTLFLYCKLCNFESDLHYRHATRHKQKKYIYGVGQ